MDKKCKVDRKREEEGKRRETNYEAKEGPKAETSNTTKVHRGEEEEQNGKGRNQGQKNEAQRDHAREKHREEEERETKGRTPKRRKEPAKDSTEEYGRKSQDRQTKAMK